LCKDQRERVRGRAKDKSAAKAQTMIFTWGAGVIHRGWSSRAGHKLNEDALKSGGGFKIEPNKKTVGAERLNEER